MLLGGLQKTSLIDYPGRVSCVLFTRGCNFRCPYCHNPSLVVSCDPTKATGVSIYEVLSFLERRRGLIDGVVISGGEPTLQRDLPDFCRTIKKMGYAIKLDTNGSRPRVIETLIQDDLVDYIATDIKTLPEHYDRYIKAGIDPEVLLSSIGHIMACGKPYEFRTTCARPMVTLDVIEGIGRRIKGAQLYILQPFVNGDILDPGFFSGEEAVLEMDDLRRFQGVASKWVHNCEVRG